MRLDYEDAAKRDVRYRTGWYHSGGLTMKNSDVYLTARQVRERYGGCSDMALWRWLQDEAMQFPRPLIINGRRLWKILDLEIFEERQSVKQTVD